MRGNKLAILILFIALVLPGCIFVFLKIFGENEFAVQPLFEDNIPGLGDHCGIQYSIPYFIPDSIRQTLRMNESSNLYLFSFDPQEGDQMKRITEASNDDPLRIIYLVPDGYAIGPRSSPHAQDLITDSSRLTYLRKCIFFLKEPFNLVLVDKNGAIRGQYTSDDREEIDRLLTEITIILKKY